VILAADTRLGASSFRRAGRASWSTNEHFVGVGEFDFVEQAVRKKAFRLDVLGSRGWSCGLVSVGLGRVAKSMFDEHV
jgi:hypothetical protein